MSINKISLRNFKCFEEVDISLSKITLLTGANSSGKSSLLCGLLGALQSQDFPFYLSPNGKYINMGDFTEMSFGNSKANSIGIDMAVKGREGEACNLTTEWAFDLRSKMPRLNHLKVTTTFFNANIKTEETNEGYLLNLSCNAEKYRQSKNFEVSKVVQSLIAKAMEIREEDATQDKTLQAFKEGFATIGDKIENLKLDDLDQLNETLIESGNAWAVQLFFDLSRTFTHLDADLNFVGSFRLHPERTYYQKTKRDLKVGVFGENYVDQILEWQDKGAPESRELKDALRDLGLLFAVRVRGLRGGRFEVRVQVRPKSVWASLSDVGFGISQFLPILVADLQLGQHSTLVVSQPEIHLHPSIQATLADYFIRQAKEKKKRYIIETHSEYLLNRVRLSIVRQEIKPSDVSVYYFENSGDHSIAHHIEFTKDGQIKNAPKGFFDTYMMDVMDIALNA